MTVNPLTFIGNSSIIDSNRLQNPTTEQAAEVKREFAKLFIDKVFMNRVSLGDIFQADEDEENLFKGMFSDDVAKMMTDDIFRQQVAEQMIDSGTLDLDFGE